MELFHNLRSALGHTVTGASEAVAERVLHLVPERLRFHHHDNSENPQPQGDGQPNAGTHPSTLRRLEAWWHGEELDPTHRSPSAPKKKKRKVEIDAPEEPVEKRPWTMDRMRFCDQMWGDSCVWPGGGEYTSRITRALALNSTQSMAVLGAGLGGTARTLAETYGVWVTGLEADKELAATAMKRSKGGLEKKAPIRVYDPETVEFKPRCYDAVFALESFFTVQNKDRLFAAIQNSLKKDGHLMFTDYVLPKDTPPSDAIREWIECEPVSPALWPVKKQLASLSTLQFDIRIAEDETKLQCRAILAAWADYVGRLQKTTVTPAVAAVIMSEAELWLRRVSLLEKGEIRLVRFHCLNRGAGKEKISSW